MNFTELRNRLNANFNANIANKVLFQTDIDKDALWELYLSSFPEGTNPVYRKRREFDCSCCRHYIKEIGGAVYIDDDLTVHSIFEFDAESDVYQPVMDALAAYVTSRPIIGLYLSKTPSVGTDFSCEQDGKNVNRWYHFHTKLPQHMVFTDRRYGTLDTRLSQFRDTRNVFKRSLDEISVDAIATVKELIQSNTLYKGTEWAKPINDLLTEKRAYDALPADKRELYTWLKATMVDNVLGRIRNHSIGVLLTDISEGMDLDKAVTRYEKIVAPANYKRPKAIFTKKMLEDAQKTVTELGYMDSLPRRFATLDDITVNNILFSNKDSAKRIYGSVFDQLKEAADVNPRQFSRVEEIGIEKFISDVLPGASEVEAFLENRHAPNMVSLIGPVNPKAPSMFKWNNAFSWAYAGNMTDSDIKENVKNAGGRVDGDLRFSLQWNDVEPDRNDLDAHCQEPTGGEHIYYSHKVSRRTGGNLDIDIINPARGVPAVENITYPSRAKMIPGDYLFLVHCFSHCGGRSGFRAEIEFDGHVFNYDYNRVMRQDEKVKVATVTLHKDGSFSIKEHLNSRHTSREMWGVRTQGFTPVSTIMYSPNYWDEQQGIGHKHYLFMLKNCVNPEQPNGFYNEYLKNDLVKHKRVFEALGGKMAVETVDDQLSGIGFSSTKRNELIVKVKGATERIMKIKF